MLKFIHQVSSSCLKAVGATTAMDYENPADSTENDAETVTK